MSAQGITIVGASAGSGKTYRLTQEVTRAVDPRSEDHIDLQGLVAVTYTRKAHAELAARIRRTLVESNAFDAATRLPLAYVGTVHAACLRLVQEFALDAGLSPNVDVVAGDASQLLREALERAVGTESCAELDRLAGRFELLWQPKAERYDWLRPVTDIMELARSNRMPPSELGAMAARSSESFLRLLPEPASDGAVLDNALARELSRAASLLARGKDETKATREAREFIEDCSVRFRDDALRWKHWEQLSRLETAKRSAADVADLKTAAAAYERHPRLHEEIRSLTCALFDAARAGLSGYESWKKERRVVDYVDMISAALELAHHPRVASELADRLRFVVVDEFQDTSPIQLALFMRLHALAGRSVWVGDRKQCIFEYAGADPALMDSVARWVDNAGGTSDRLGRNHRSRPELVEVCSELFAAALAPYGFDRGEVVVEAARTPSPALDTLPPLGLLCLDTQNKRNDAGALADGVHRLLAAPASTPVCDRLTNTARDVRPGDVAVLVATNAEASEVAAALYARDIRVSLARAGLLSTPEGTLADAALRCLVDEHDALSAATIDALTGFDGSTAEAWLEARLQAVAASPEEREEPRSRWQDALDRVRAMLAVLSPREALDESLTALDALHLCARWPDPAQRIANLDALRATATAYEDRCAQQREAGTVAGLLRYFDDLRKERLHRNEVLASDDQHVSSDDGAVTVCTYHKSKGLEWPVVIMSSLDRTEKRHAFEVRPESDRDDAGFDPAAPLAGRWIRYWPWPLGALKSSRLWDAAERSPEGQRVSVREEKERLRLLYVGFTRARDHLVLATRVAKGQAKSPWLDALALDLPVRDGDGVTATTRIGCDDGRWIEVPTRVWRFGAGPERRAVPQPAARSPRWFARTTHAVDAPTYSIAPSRAAEEWPELPQVRVGRVERLPSAMRIDAKQLAHVDDDVLGKAMHAFLGADVEGLSLQQRLERADRLLDAAGLRQIVRPESLVEAGDGLRTWVGARWPSAEWCREIPIESIVDGSHGERRVSGVIDLLLETSEGRVIIDHKTFPAQTEAAWRARVKEFFPQMAAYATALARLDDRPVLGCWVHFPLGGGMVEIIRRD